MSDSETNMAAALEALQGRIGESSPPTEWFEMTQDRINEFAEVTMDHQWIHVDVDRAKAGPFGAPIAHGHLTLSIMVICHAPKSCRRCVLLDAREKAIRVITGKQRPLRCLQRSHQQTPPRILL